MFPGAFHILGAVRARWILLTIFLIGVALRATVWAELRGDAEFHQLVGDSARYVEWSDDIARGDYLSRREGVFYQAPLYPYFLAAHRWVFGEWALSAVRVTQILLGGAGAVMLAAGALLWVGARGAWTAGLLLAGLPSAVFFDLQIDKASLDGFLTCAILLAIVQFQQAPASRWLFLVGLLIGALTLSRENAVALLAVVLAMAWLGGRSKKVGPGNLRQWGFPLAALLGFALVVLPVSLRNKLIGGEFHLVTCQFGPNFFIGNGAAADGVYRPLRAGRGDPQFERSDAIELAEAAEQRKLTPREVSAYWTRRALGDIAETPARWAGLTARKALLVFHETEIADNNDIYTQSAGSWALWCLRSVHGQTIVLLAGVLGAFAGWTRRQSVWPVFACITVMTAAVAGFYLFARYRFCIAPMMLLACSLVWVRDRGPLEILSVRGLACTASCILLFAVANAAWVLPERQRGVAEYNYALACERRALPAAAMRAYRDAIARNPRLTEARNNLGLLYASESNYSAAVTEFTAVIEARPNDAVARNNLGMALGGQGKLQAAAVEFERAVLLDPNYTVARENLRKARDRAAAPILPTLLNERKRGANDVD